MPLTLTLTLVGLCLSTTAAPSNSQDVTDAMLALGLSAESLACLDVTGDEPATVLDRLVEEYDLYSQLLSYQASMLAQQRIVFDANATLRDMAQDESALLALSQGQTQLSTLSTLITQTRSVLIDTLLDGVADATLIDPVLDAQGYALRLPSAYRIAVDTDQEAKELAWALRMEDMADATDSDLPSSANTAIQAAEGQYPVQSALARVSSQQAANQAVIDQWVAGH